MFPFKTLVLGLTCGIMLIGCGSASSKGSSTEEVIIYSNADVEAVEVIQEVLDEAGYEGQYISNPLAPVSWAGACWLKVKTQRQIWLP